MQDDKLRFDRSYPPIERHLTGFDPATLQAYLDGEFVETRNLVKRIITQPEFRHFEGTDPHEYRRQVLSWSREMSDAGIGRLFFPPEFGGESDLRKLMAVLETISFHDGSLLIKLGVQFGLFGGSIQQLGTEYHHRKYLAKTASCELFGGFAMTEIGHGSNVQALETTAVYDSEHREFIINSPSFSSGKTFRGNGAVDGQVMVVFAQLYVGAANHGVHAFVVPIRDDRGQPLPGITVEDNGLKLGLNGVDNGRIWFHNTRIARTELLNRFAEVTDNGQYRSEIKSNNHRFFTMIGTLVNGRITMALAANNMAKSAVTIAIRYAARRRQFGGGVQETLLLDYPATQRRLMPLLANVYALDFAVKRLARILETAPLTSARPIENLAAGITAFRRLTRHRGIDAYAAFSQLQPQLLELAEAYAERQALESFLEAVADLPDQTLQRPLRKLADLFALYHLEKHKAWFLENGFMSGKKSKAITKHVTQLCAEVRRDAVALVDAFGIPDQCLGAPIALG